MYVLYLVLSVTVNLVTYAAGFPVREHGVGPPSEQPDQNRGLDDTNINRFVNQITLLLPDRAKRYLHVVAIDKFSTTAVGPRRNVRLRKRSDNSQEEKVPERTTGRKSRASLPEAEFDDTITPEDYEWLLECLASKV